MMHLRNKCVKNFNGVEFIRKISTAFYETNRVIEKWFMTVPCQQTNVFFSAHMIDMLAGKQQLKFGGLMFALFWSVASICCANKTISFHLLSGK